MGAEEHKRKLFLLVFGGFFGLTVFLLFIS